MTGLREDLTDLYRSYQRGVIWIAKASGAEPYLLRLLDWLQKHLP